MALGGPPSEATAPATCLLSAVSCTSITAGGSLWGGAGPAWTRLLYGPWSSYRRCVTDNPVLECIVTVGSGGQPFQGVARRGKVDGR